MKKIKQEQWYRKDNDEDMDEWEKHNEKIHTLFFSTIHEMHKIRIANHTSADGSTSNLWKLTCPATSNL